MRKVLKSVLSQVSPAVVLVDIGASGKPPALWRRIGRYSTYIGFDPDARDFQIKDNTLFLKEILINAAVTDTTVPSANFYFTKFPHCSSTLEPNTESLKKYAFSPLFDVKKQGTVPAISFEAVAQRCCVDRFDWVKIDSQGTDLRLFKSIPQQLLKTVLAADVEPGLISAYRGEDVFVDVHTYMTSQGFWLSRLNLRGSSRISSDTVDELLRRYGKLKAFYSFLGLRESPGWVEARYLRTAEWLNANSSGPREFLLSWVFAVLDNQYGFAFEIAKAYSKIYEGNGFLSKEALRFMQSPFNPARWQLNSIRMFLRDFQTRLGGNYGKNIQ